MTTVRLHESFLTRLEQMSICILWQERTERARRTAVSFFPPTTLPLFGRIFIRFPRSAKNRFRRRSGNRILAEMFPKDIAPIAI